MSQRGPIQRQIEVLQQQVAELQKVLSEKRLGLDKIRPQVRVAQTMADGSYPGDTGTAFNLKFRDPTFTETDGAQALSGDFQDTAVQRVGLTVPGAFIASGTDVLVAEIDGKHYIIPAGSGKCGCGGVDCSACEGGKSPEQMELEISGLTNGATSTGGLDLAAAVNGTHVVNIENCEGFKEIDVGVITDGTGLTGSIGDLLRVVVFFDWAHATLTQQIIAIRLYVETSATGGASWTLETSTEKILTHGAEYDPTTDCSLDSYVMDTLVGNEVNGWATITPGNFEARPLGNPPQVQQVNLAAAATTFAANSSTVKLTGDAGGNAVETIAGSMAYEGNEITLVPQDSLVSIVHDATATADTIHLAQAWQSEKDRVLRLKRKESKWIEASRTPEAGVQHVLVHEGEVVTDNGEIVWAL